MDSDQYDQEFFSFVAKNELRIPKDLTNGKILGFHERGWRASHNNKIQWVLASGNGTIVSYVVFHRQYSKDFPVPYAVALVELSEGPQILGHVIDIDADRLQVGMKVKACFGNGKLNFRREL